MSLGFEFRFEQKKLKKREWPLFAVGFTFAFFCEHSNFEIQSHNQLRINLLSIVAHFTGGLKSEMNRNGWRSDLEGGLLLTVLDLKVNSAKLLLSPPAKLNSLSVLVPRS